MAGPIHPSHMRYRWEWGLGCLPPKLSSLPLGVQAVGWRERAVREGWHSRDRLHGGGGLGWPWQGVQQTAYLPCGLISFLLRRLRCLLPLGLHPNLVITFPREMDLAFPGIETPGSLDPSQSGPKLLVGPVGFAICHLPNGACLEPVACPPPSREPG